MSPTTRNLTADLTIRIGARFEIPATIGAHRAGETLEVTGAGLLRAMPSMHGHNGLEPFVDVRNVATGQTTRWCIGEHAPETTIGCGPDALERAAESKRTTRALILEHATAPAYEPIPLEACFECQDDECDGSCYLL